MIPAGNKANPLRRSTISQKQLIITQVYSEAQLGPHQISMPLTIFGKRFQIAS